MGHLRDDAYASVLFKNASVVIGKPRNCSLQHSIAESIIPETSKMSNNLTLTDFSAKYILQGLTRDNFHNQKDNLNLSYQTANQVNRKIDSKNQSIVIERKSTNDHQEEYEGQMFTKLSPSDDYHHSKLSIMKNIADNYNLRPLKDMTEKRKLYMLKTYETVAPYYFIKYDNLFSKFISTDSQEISQIIRVVTSPTNSTAFACDQKGNLVSWNYESRKQQQRKSYGLIGLVEEQTINRKSEG